MSIRCAIIDDEYLARKYMKDYVAKIPYLELIGDFNSPMKVMEELQAGKIDLLLLDIQMPDISGLEFLKSLEARPYVILTTAYEEYALEGYELEIKNRVPLKIVPNDNNFSYLKTKKDKLGHFLDHLDSSQ